jgi:hypothetical protein
MGSGSPILSWPLPSRVAHLLDQNVSNHPLRPGSIAEGDTVVLFACKYAFAHASDQSYAVLSDGLDQLRLREVLFQL